MFGARADGALEGMRVHVDQAWQQGLVW
jgi:hypothetical protein